MSKKNKNDLGRGLLRRQGRDHKSVSSRHTTDTSSETQVSMTENTSVEEFLSHAEASQRSFEAERGGLGATRIVRYEGETIVEEPDEEDEQGQPFCSIPKKPDWRDSRSPEEYLRLEQEQFLAWQKKLSELEKRTASINLPPFEKNIEFWRQLWRMVEISDVVVQVVDARDPLFYYNSDLTEYANSTSSEEKLNVMLVNKADFLTRHQRETWAEYLRDSDLKAIYFSAVAKGDEDDDEETDLDFNSPRIFTPRQVLRTLQQYQRKKPYTVGFLGYPNVGKSSTINCFLTNKRLQVSATPGKTKHYQTHILRSSDSKGDVEVVLVDGPGLVMPDLTKTKASMVLAGILPVDNLTDSEAPVDLLLSDNLPASIIERHYGLIKSSESQRSLRLTPGSKLLSSLALRRGFMKPGGMPDGSRAARILLKDYAQGKLLFCRAPPGVDQATFFPLGEVESEEVEEDLSLMESFPELRIPSGVHVRGVRGMMDPTSKKHSNKKKREKARRVFKQPNST